MQQRPTGVQAESGAVELNADWRVSGGANPRLLRAPRPFRPGAPADMIQVCVKVENNIINKFDYYYFEKIVTEWNPVLDEERSISASGENASLLASMNLIPPEHFSWSLVTDLVPKEAILDEHVEQLQLMAPEAGTFILLSLSRLKINE
jgi:hypothetical protein